MNAINLFTKFKAALLFAVLLALVPFSAQAQLDTNGTGPRNPKDLHQYVEIFNGAQVYVISLNGVAGTTQITTGRGVLVGVEINTIISSGASATSPFILQLWDSSTTSVDWTTPKITADQMGLPYSASSPNTRLTKFTPVQFYNGIAVQNGTTATNSTAAFYFIK